ncbi:type II toxin-antitoxin system HicA family toxin [Methanocella sp. MCL-LM]|uniref:type II toxin-antitoxin system HicA family toxin n=1 Tax=Methanocella sp. MCL-LM TaxID=3412035 RepID=UPI003C72EBE2
MPLPVVKGKELRRFIERRGYVLVSVKGSHFKFRRKDSKGFKIIIPIHGNEEIADGTLENIIRYLALNEGLSEDDIRRAISDEC